MLERPRDPILATDPEPARSRPSIEDLMADDLKAQDLVFISGHRSFSPFKRPAAITGRVTDIMASPLSMKKTRRRGNLKRSDWSDCAAPISPSAKGRAERPT